MKKTNKIISVLVLICMIISLLPAHFALATDAPTTTDPAEDYIKGRGTLADLKASNFRGAVMSLSTHDTDSEIAEGVYKVTFGIYNITELDGYYHAFQVDTSVVTPVYDETGEDVAIIADDAQYYPEEAINGEPWTDYWKATLVNTTNIGANTAAVYGTKKNPKYISDGMFDLPIGIRITGRDNGKLQLSTYVISLGGELGNFGKGYFDDVNGSKEITEQLGTGTKVTKYGYISPKDTLVNVYSLFFKLKDGVTAIDSDTFSIYCDTMSTYPIFGGAAMKAPATGTAVVPDYDQHGVYLLGDFPKPAATEPQKITFNKIQNTSGDPIEDATVNVYSDAEHKNLVDTAAHVSDGKYETQAKFDAGSTYYWEVQRDDYESKSDSRYVGTSGATVETITLTLSSEQPRTVNVKVTNADTGDPVEGVTVKLRGLQVEKQTNSSGEITGLEYTPGPCSVVVDATSDYQEYTDNTVSIKSSGTTKIEIKLVPNRKKVTLPKVQQKNGTDSELTNATLSVKKLSDNPTAAWNNGNDLMTTTSGTEVELAMGTTYSITASQTGYKSDVKYVVVNSSGNVTYYANYNESTGEVRDVYGSNIMYIEKLDDPYYHVVITKGENRTYTAVVKLCNAVGKSGTFGLRYDKNLFDFGTFNITNSAVHLWDPKEGDAPVSSAVTASTDSNTIGYHVFTWQADDENGINTVTGETEIATYTFILKDGKTENDLASDSFTVMPYDKTAQALEYLSDIDVEDTREYDTYKVFLDEKWRYVDEDNSTTPLGEGRISESKAVINGGDTKGFYQTQVLGTLTNEDAAGSYDTRVFIDFDYKKSGLSFYVTDKETTLPISGAKVALYDASGETLVDTLTTDATGIASYSTDASAGEKKYNYVVSAKGYWNDPEEGKTEVTVYPASTDDEGAGTTNVYSELEKKIYHTPVLQDKNGQAMEKTVAVLGGDRLAYADRYYTFTIKPAPGKEFDTSDANYGNAVAIVGKGLDGEKEGTSIPLTLDKKTNTYTLDKQYIYKTPLANITDDNPSEDGFKSDDIIIKYLGDFKNKEEKYIVTAYTDDYATIDYAPEGGWDKTADSTETAITVNVTPKEDATKGTKTGTFTFTPKEGYMVEKVFVNDVQIHNFDGETEEFKYTFGEVDMDNNITVICCDATGLVPSEDSIIALVVGDFGHVDVAKSENEKIEAENEIRKTRRIYLNVPEGDTLQFTATADQDYVVDTVTVQEGRGKRNPLTLADGRYKVAPEKGTVKTVYVTFRYYTGTQEGDTPTVFVNAHVDSGKGTIDHTGILIYNKSDSPTFELTAEDGNWQTTGVRVAPFEEEDKGDVTVFSPAVPKTTYTLDSLTEDKSIGAIFKELEYKVTGFVDFDQGKKLKEEYKGIQTPAKITFVRKIDGEQTDEEYYAETTLTRTDATFSADLPAGTYDVIFTKQGYVDYTLTDFVVKSDEENKFGGPASKHLVPFIGNTNATGKTVSLSDAAVIWSGMRQNVNQTVFKKADVDDDTVVSADTDLMYVKFNYGLKAVEKAYETWLNE